MKLSQKLLVKIFDNPLGRLYLGVPKGKKIYKITESSAHYFTGEIAKNGQPIICTGNCVPGGKWVFNQIMKLAKLTSVLAVIGLAPHSLLPLIALTDTGAKAPTATGTPNNEWTNPTYAYADDTNRTTTTRTTDGKKWQSYATFGLGVPAGATINGIEIAIKWYLALGGGNQNSTLMADWYCTSDVGLSYDRVGTWEKTVEGVDTLGGSTDLWGTTPIATDFSDANFYAQIEGFYLGGNGTDGTTTWYVNYLTVKVYYTLVGTCALTGTVTTATETDIVTGGKTIILTLTNDTWVATVGEDNAITTALIGGIDSAQSEAAGWDAVVKANMVYTDVTRTSDTVVTITLGAEATYSITANETITVTIPASAVTLAAQIVASPTFTVTNVASAATGNFFALF
jgi:hypothetical protein